VHSPCMQARWERTGRTVSAEFGSATYSNEPRCCVVVSFCAGCRLLQSCEIKEDSEFLCNVVVVQ
jgi:hypothetical protein